MGYFAGLGLVANGLTLPHDLIAWALAMILLFRAYASWSVLLEASLIPLTWLVLAPLVPRQGAAWHIPLVAVVLIMVSHRVTSRAATWVSLLCIAGWVVLALFTNSLGWVELVFVGTTLVWVSAYAFYHVRPARCHQHGQIDMILCSFSGNTAHYAQVFAESLQGVLVVHRFHKQDEFRPHLAGDTLVLAFPVSGWKPPWPLTEYLLTRLPRGGGKPAFILYTSAGGPENAGFVAWALLTLRGYEVVGRLWCTYPLNVPTLRIGPRSLWHWADSHTPFERDMVLASITSAALARGDRAGLPVILWPTPLALVGFLLDNRWLNRFAYRAYAWPRRCTGCGFCIRYCPAGSISWVAGMPRATGTCYLCFGCVNHCPQHAMHLRFWTEYGGPYKTRWPELVAGHGSCETPANSCGSRSPPGLG